MSSFTITTPELIPLIQQYIDNGFQGKIDVEKAKNLIIHFTGTIIDVEERDDLLESIVVADEDEDGLIDLSVFFMAVESLIRDHGTELPAFSHSFPGLAIVLYNGLLKSFSLPAESAKPKPESDEMDDNKEEEEVTQGSVQLILIGLLLPVLDGNLYADSVPHAALMEIALRILKLETLGAQSEALMLIGAISNNLGPNFNVYITDVIPEMIRFLNLEEQTDQVICACGLLGDICRAIGGEILPYCDEIFPALLKLTSSPSANRRIKPVALTGIADIALAIEGNFERYCSPILEVLNSAALYNFPVSDDEEEIEFENSLNEALLIAYTSVVQGLRIGSRQEEIKSSLNSMVRFLQKAAVNPNKDENVLKNALGFLGDLGSAFGKDMKDFYKEPWVKNLLHEGDDSDMGETVQWVKGIIKNCQ